MRAVALSGMIPKVEQIMCKIIEGYIDPLTWDSIFFKKRVGRLLFDNQKRRFYEQVIDYDLVTVKIDPKEYILMDLLIFNGFLLAETEITFLYKIEHCPKEIYKIAGEGDINVIRNMAKLSFNKHSRYRYPWFNQSSTANYYAQWAENAILGSFDNECLVLEEGNDVYGFVTIKAMSKNTGRIGLITTNPKIRRTGVGLKLINCALSRLFEKGIKNIYVTTQISNMPAIHLYERSGALVQSIYYWLYYYK